MSDTPSDVRYVCIGYVIREIKLDTMMADGELVVFEVNKFDELVEKHNASIADMQKVALVRFMGCPLIAFDPPLVGSREDLGAEAEKLMIHEDGQYHEGYRQAVEYLMGRRKQNEEPQ